MNEKQAIPGEKSSEKSMRGIPPYGDPGSQSYTGGFIMDWDMRHNVNPIISGVVDMP